MHIWIVAIQYDRWLEFDITCSLNMVVSALHTRGIWWTTKWSSCRMDCGRTKYISWYCIMVGASHVEVLPNPSWLESQCFHDWWCIGWNCWFEVISIFLCYNISCIYFKNITLKCTKYGRRITWCEVILCV